MVFLSNFEREKLSVDHTEAFVKAARQELENHLQQLRHESPDEKEALFYKRLDYFVEKVEILISFF